MIRTVVGQQWRQISLQWKLKKKKTNLQVDKSSIASIEWLAYIESYYWWTYIFPRNKLHINTAKLNFTWHLRVWFLTEKKRWRRWEMLFEQFCYISLLLFGSVSSICFLGQRISTGWSNTYNLLNFALTNNYHS